MDNYLVCKVYLFTMTQKINIYKDNKCIKMVKCKMAEMEDTIFNLCKEYDITDVKISGNINFGLKIKQNLTAAKYSDHKIEISFI